MSKSKYSSAKQRLGVLGQISGTSGFLTVTKSGVIKISKDYSDIRKKKPRKS
jgi:hypothetical protein